MKKLLFIITVIGTLAIASCTKHACPAYGSIRKAAQPAQAERV